MSTKLAQQTQKTAGIGNGMRTATIAAASGRTITLAVGGGLISQGVGVVGSYVPVVGDTVAVFRQDSSWMILGTTIGGGGSITGTVLVSFAGVGTDSTAVDFGTTFAVPPVVTTNIDIAQVAQLRWCSRGINATTTGFTMYVFSADAVVNTWSNVPVSWTATAR